MALESGFLPDEAHSLSQMEMLNADYYKRYLEVVCNNATLAIFIMDDPFLVYLTIARRARSRRRR
ncbi:hypothetical protein [Chroogloeocystis siderophila]|jgi:hypothetical protein|uniref:hypothetical protein n=1 Tax=Chroogloeocystis siderophila TaxID=329163 RepID=UPI000AE526C7|nr:hypothetical protein [Chroogloeocystis siderophila]